MIDLEAIKQRADAATEGPWEALGRIVEQSDWSVGTDEIVSCEVDCGSYCQGGTGKGVTNPADAEFISHARTDVPALLDEVERLQGIVDRVRWSIHTVLHALHLTGDLDAREVLNHITTALVTE